MSTTITSLLTVGTFDLFHVGHLHLLEACRKIVGDYGKVTVGVNTDEFVEEFKGKAPVVPFKDRQKVLRACRFVDEVVANSAHDMRPLLVNVHPTFLAVGTDWAGGDRYFNQTNLSQAWLDQAGIILLYIGRPEGGMSSSEIRSLAKTK